MTEQKTKKQIILIRNPVVSKGRLYIDEPLMRNIYILEPLNVEKGDKEFDMLGTESIQVLIEKEEMIARGFET